MLDFSCQAQRHTHAERGHDLYETPRIAIEKLLKVETLPHRIWEPAVGRGALARVLAGAGHDVIGTDLIDYGAGYTGGRDFLMERKAPDGCTAICTNPPYKLANEFVAHALDLAPTVIMLLRLAFMESARRTPILENCGLGKVYVFRSRLPMMHRDQWAGRKANSGMAFCWMRWDRGYTGDTIIRRI